MITLGVNIDHVATIRQARRTVEPDPVAAAVLAELGGADGITVHLREDRRHIQDRDVRLLRQTVRTHLNLEMAPTEEMVSIALDVKPDYVTLVPEKREEVTTEGGIDIVGNFDRFARVVEQLKSAGIPVSWFIDAQPSQIEAAANTQAKFIELHTGQYAETHDEASRQNELEFLKKGCEIAIASGLRVNAGHGLTYWNVYPVACLPGMEELNIGHTIISRAVLVGLERAVKEMKLAMRGPTIMNFVVGMHLGTIMTTYYYVLASQNFLLEEEPFDEVLKERTRNYQEQNKEIDFWLVKQPAFLETPEFAQIKAKCPQPAVAVISTNRQFITWLKLRLEYVITGEFMAPSDTIPSHEASLASV